DRLRVRVGGDGGAVEHELVFVVVVGEAERVKINLPESRESGALGQRMLRPRGRMEVVSRRKRRKAQHDAGQCRAGQAQESEAGGGMRRHSSSWGGFLHYAFGGAARRAGTPAQSGVFGLV